MPVNPSLRFLGSALALAATVCLIASNPAAAHPACTTNPQRLTHPLHHTRSQLQDQRPITIVAIGSSSTAGAGATSDAASYPSRLAALLQVRFANVPIRVFNRGVNGEEEQDMIERFESDVVSEKPDLVIWQVGANAVMRDRPLAMEESLIDLGTRRLRAIGADVILLDLQYTPAMLEKETTAGMLDLIDAQGRKNQINVFHRYELMKHWHESQNLAFDVFGVEDGLHMNDWGYDCFARNFAAALADAIAPAAVASAQQNLNGAHRTVLR
jgi:lysophospholipase L1-like esterase